MTVHTLPRLAHGARALEQIRLGGKRPLCSVVVADDPSVASMLSGTGFHVLRVGTGAYDMRAVRGLNVIAALVGQDVLGVLASIEDAKPANLHLLMGADVSEFLELVLEAWRKVPQAAEVVNG